MRPLGLTVLSSRRPAARQKLREGHGARAPLGGPARLGKGILGALRKNASA
jgi:hypothetical protein